MANDLTLRSALRELLDVTTSHFHMPARMAAATKQASAALAAPAAPRESTLPYEHALYELINKIDTGLDTGDILADARRASAALDGILAAGDLVANAYDHFKQAGEGVRPVALKEHGAWDGLEALDDLPDGTELYATPRPVARVVAHRLLDGDGAPESEWFDGSPGSKSTPTGCRYELAYATPQPAAQAASAVPLLAADHKGMRVDYSGLLKQARGALQRGIKEPALAEMLRQLQGHLTELGQRWYAGDTAVVDEILQLYCIEDDARAALTTQGESRG